MKLSKISLGLNLLLVSKIYSIYFQIRCHQLKKNALCLVLNMVQNTLSNQNNRSVIQVNNKTSNIISWVIMIVAFSAFLGLSLYDKHHEHSINKALNGECYTEEK